MNAEPAAWVHALAWTLALLALAWAARGLPWYKLRGDADAQRVLGMAVLALVAMRGFNTQAVLGVQLHFIGAAVATLMFGWRFALWAMATVSLAARVADVAWHGWAFDFIATGALPVLVAHTIWRMEQRLPANLFVYVFVAAFFGAAISMMASTLFKATVEAMSGAHQAAQYLVAMIPMMFGEAFFSGGAMSLVVVYRPQWCASFDDARYLGTGD